MASKFKNYDVLRKRLSNAGFKIKGKYSKFPYSGRIANFLLSIFSKSKECFISKKEFISFKLIKYIDGSADELGFLENLCDENFIVIECIMFNKVYNYYIRPYKELSDLLDKEVNQQTTKHEVVVSHKKIEALERGIRRIIEKIDPPYTEEKYKRYMEEKD